ncbi:Conserved_hypothetical protein [Hexamita inflata]|uniref:Uncharacterized protein n=1 Tax=Hexamita inflata TaxID=28002 RepID=A0AA86UZV5_9EUKA|nr:Conserved hypothetical protein [Hexamita inflata]
MSDDLSLSSYLRQNKQQFTFCVSEQDIPACADVLKMELQQLLNIDKFDINDSVLVSNVLNALIQKLKSSSTQFQAQEDNISKLRQNFQIKQQQIESQQVSYEGEIDRLVSQMKQLQLSESQTQQKFQRIYSDYQQLQTQNQDYVRKLDIAEKTRRKFVMENDDLQAKLQNALKAKPENINIQRHQVPDIKILENAIKELYKDIYRAELQKTKNFDENIALLAEAISHVQKTYNEDMESTTKQIAFLNKRINDMEQRNKTK